MFWAIAAVLCGLIAFPTECGKAAGEAAMLWWTRVFPALTPYLILTGLAMRLRPPLRRIGNLHPHALTAFLFGIIGGYPIGARILGEAQRDGAIPSEQTLQFSYAAGWMSPAFLISFTAIGLFGRTGLALPLCLSVYPIALLTLLIFGRSKQSERPVDLPRRPFAADDLTDAIQNGIDAILRIGGCMVLAKVIAALLCALRVPWLLGRVTPLPDALWETILNGLLEMTSGCERAAALPLPLAMRLALCVFFQVFGGASVLLQTRSFLRVPHFSRYIFARLCMGVLSALICYGICLLLPIQAEPAMATPQEILFRAQSLFAVLFPAMIGLLFSVFFAIWVSPVPHRHFPGDKPVPM